MAERNDPPSDEPPSVDAQSASATPDEAALPTLAMFAATARNVVAMLAAGFQWMSDHGEEVQGFFDNSRRHLEGDWGYLIKAVGSMSGITVAFGIEAQRRLSGRFGADATDVFLPELIDGWIREPVLMQEVRDALASSALPQPLKIQLARGIDEVEAGAWEIAVPLLIVPLEGAFWWLGQQRGVVEMKKGKPQLAAALSPTRRQLNSIDALFNVPQMGIEPRLRKFLLKLSYGNSGNAFRHGTAERGYHGRALCLYVSLIAWLGAAGLLDPQKAIRGGVLRARAAADVPARGLA